MCLGINEGNHIILVPYCNGLAIRAPADVNILPWVGKEEKLNLLRAQSYGL